MATVKRKYSFKKKKLSSQRQSVFGGELSDMTTEESAIPEMVEKLIEDIEFRGKKYGIFVIWCSSSNVLE